MLAKTFPSVCTSITQCTCTGESQLTIPLIEFKRKVHPKMKSLSVITHPRVISKTIEEEEFLFVTYTIIQSITSSEMCSLYLTHPSAHTRGAVV